MEVCAESLATKGHKQLDHWLTDVNQATIKSPRMVTVDSSQVKRNQDTMESPEQLVFAYQHNGVDVGMTDTVDGLDHYKVVDFDHFGYMVVQYSQRFAVQNLGTLVGIVAVGIALSTVAIPWVVALH